MNKRIINWIVTVIVLSVLFYLLFVMFTGADEVINAMEDLNLIYIPLILGLVFVAYRSGGSGGIITYMRLA
jgi:uncharacterized membrane protein YbhN (UPF0104 family)